MAKAAKTKSKKHIEEEYPLSDVQDLSKTKRTDAAEKKQKKAPAEIKPVVIVEKVKVEDGDFLNVSYSRIEKDGAQGTYPNVGHHGRYMHPDLRAVFLELRVHLALITEHISLQQLKNIESYNEDLVKQFTVTSVSIKPDEGVTLSGWKKLKRGPAFNFNTPFTRFEEDQQSAYRYASELQDLVELLVAETAKYLDGSKVGVNPQSAIPFPEVKKDSFSEESK